MVRGNVPKIIVAELDEQCSDPVWISQPIENNGFLPQPLILAVVVT
jgi:hypothetical protein